MNERTPLDHARDLIARGLSPIPVPHKSKGPRVEGWQNLRLLTDDLPRYFNRAPANVGTLLGENAGWIVDVDLDHPLAVELADALLPHTGMVWGRDGKPRSHRLYRLARPANTRKWQSKAAGMLVELRSTGCQTVAPGSTHPSGEPVRWDDDGEPATIEPGELIAAIEALANAVRRGLGEGPDSTGAPVPRPVSCRLGRSSNYGREALRREAATVATTPEGGRNDALNRAAFKVGMLIGGGEVERTDAESSLLVAAQSCGLPAIEARRTIASGFASGEEHPRTRPADKGTGTPSHPKCDRSGDADPRDAEADAMAKTTPPTPEQDEGSYPTQAEQLVRLAMELCRLGQTPKREPFAVMHVGPNVAGLLRGSGGSLRDILAREYRRRYGRVASSSAYADALAALRGEAAEAPTEAAHLRVGPFGEGIVLDLGTVDGAAVVVDAAGWRIVDRSPILFQRTALSGELPMPERGGNLNTLRELLNVTDDTWPILLGWMVAALMPDLPHPILVMGGLQGAGKTTAARYICGLFDPSDAPTRSQPRDPEAWAMSAANGWTTVIDNVSSIPDWWSDALCKAVTGDGWVRRTLYTDGDVSVLSFRRVVAMTSIDAGALRGDLGERLVLVDLETIPATKRRTERALNKMYKAARPAMLGALLDLLAGALSRLDTVILPELPRMADFARVLAAMDATIGTNALALYGDQGSQIAGEVLDDDPVGKAVVMFMRSRGEWRGNASTLLGAIQPDGVDDRWPKSGRALAAQLKRLAPALELQGIRITPPARTDRTRVYVLQPTAQIAQPPENAADGAESEFLNRAVPAGDTGDRPSNRPDAQCASTGSAGDSEELNESVSSTHESNENEDGWGEIGP